MGIIALLATGGPVFGQRCPSYFEPAANFCSMPRVIPGTPGHHVVLMDASAATDVVFGCTSMYGKTVWFEVTPEENGWITVSTCHPATTYDTVSRVWFGGEATCEGIQSGCEFDDTPSDPHCQNDCYLGSTFLFSGAAGQRYLIEVGAHNDNEVACPMCLGLIVSVGTPCGEVPRNLACELAREIPGTPGTHTIPVDVEGAVGPGFPPTQCVGNTPVGHSVWFKTTPTVSGPLTFSTCNDGTTYDTVIQAFAGQCDFMEILPCVDDTSVDPACDTGCQSPARRGSAMTIDANAGVTYYFQVSSYNNNAAGCDLCLWAQTTLAECDDADDCDDSNACTNDSCISGACQHLAAAGSPCSDDGNQCTLDICNTGGGCDHRFLSPGTPCGDQASSTCDGPDYCDGLGTCVPNLAPPGTACTPDDFVCTLDQCDSNGVCRHPNAPNGTACGSPSNTDCDNPDTCVNGQCVPNFQPSGTVCRAAASVCDVVEVCTGDSAACPVNLFAGSGTPCPDDGDECTRDICNGTGTCIHPQILGCCPSQYECCVNADCYDGLYCSGVETCVAHLCQAGAPPCPPGSACVEEGDRCGPDCNRNEVDDLIDLETGKSLDCNRNVQPDECDIAAGVEPDCNSNGVPDACDLSAGNSTDEDGNGRPDECDDMDTAIVRINEIMPRPGTGESQWIELYTGSAGSIANWQLVIGNGGPFAIPANVPLLPQGSFVLIRFDGAGPAGNDLDPADHLIVLHTPAAMVNPLNQLADSVGLYAPGDRTPASLRDFIGYGAPPGASANHAISAGLWHPSWWVSLHPGSGRERENAPLLLRLSVGLYPGYLGRDPDHWIPYIGDDRTTGLPNGIPRATWSTTSNGGEFGQDGLAIGWSLVPGARYRFQFDDDPAFGSPAVDVERTGPHWTPQTPPTPGTYYWRVRAIDLDGRASPWSVGQRVNVIMPDTTAGGGQQNVLTMAWLRQRKDTRLLCLDGDVEGNPLQAPPKETWDAVHPDAIYNHGRNSCVRASIAMAVTHYGGNLSQDRIAYEYFERNGNPIKNWGGVGDPHKDLGHDMTTITGGNNGASGGRLFEWALGLGQGVTIFSPTKPSFANVRAWIDAGRPIVRGDPGNGIVGHMTVIGGYRILSNGTEQVRNFDPWSGVTWETFSTLAMDEHWVPPATAPNRRSDEAGIHTDADGDGVMDWDEQVRFHTNPNQADSDGDFVTDRFDIREYIFALAGNYSLRSGDMDNDGLRKERDEDNDNDWALDGCEDTNHNGRYESNLGETDNFNASSCGTNCHDAYEPNETVEQAHLMAPGSWQSTIGPGDVDCFAFQPNDVVDVQIRVTYQVRPQAGNNLGAVLDNLWSASETTLGTLVLNSSRMSSGRHVFCVYGGTSTAWNCYRVELSTTPTVITADAFDDQSPPGEPRNDTFTTAAVLPDLLASIPYPIASQTLDLNHDISSDIDYFTVQLPPEADSDEECCPLPLDPEQTQGHFRVLIYPEASRPFDFKLYRPDGSVVHNTSGLFHLFDCPHSDFPDGSITFSIRDPAGRSYYRALVGYSRCYYRIYPDWWLEYEPPLFKWEIPILPDNHHLVYPIDPDVVARFFAGTQTEPFPPEFGFVSVIPKPLPRPADYKLDIRLPRGGPLALALINEDGNVMAEAFGVVGGATAGEETLEPVMRKRLEVHDLPPGMYFLRVSGGAFGTPYILDVDLDGDFNSDSAVDLRDVASFQRCFGTGNVQPPLECAEGDLSGDGRTDLGDVPILVRSMTGPR